MTSLSDSELESSGLTGFFVLTGFEELSSSDSVLESSGLTGFEVSFSCSGK